jgi:hypothetical protein
MPRSPMWGDIRDINLITDRYPDLPRSSLVGRAASVHGVERALEKRRLV